MKWRRVAAGMVAALAVLGGTLAAVALLHGGGWLRAAGERHLQAVFQPQVRIGEKIRWGWREGLALQVRDLALLGDGGEVLLHINEMTLAWPWRDVLARRLEAATLHANGVRALLRRDSTGHWEAADWLHQKESAGAGTALPGALPAVRIEGVWIELHDELDGFAGTLTLPHLETEAMRANTPLALSADLQLALNAPQALHAQGTLKAALAPGLKALEDLETRFEGETSGWRINGAHLRVDHIDLGGEAGLKLTGGELATDFHGPGETGGHGHLHLERLGRDARGWHGAGTVGLETVAPVQAHLYGEFTVQDDETTGTLKGTLMDASLAGQWRYSAREQPPASAFLSLEHLDLNALRAAVQEDGGEENDPSAWLDWSVWPVNGEVRVGTLLAQGITVRDARLRLGETSTTH